MKKSHLIILLVLLASILAYYIPFGLELANEGHLGISVLVFSAGLWVLAPIPLQITGLLIPVALVGTGILEVKAAFAPFASPVVFLILGSLFLAEAMRKHGLTRRLTIMLLDRSQGNPQLMLLSLMVVAALASMWVFSTAVVAMLIPVCLAIGSKVKKPYRDEFVSVLLMSLVFATTLGALSTILGASSNAVASGSLSEVQSWSFLDWMKFGTPLAALFVPLTWLILVTFLFPDINQLLPDDLQEQFQNQESMSDKERKILYILVGAIFCWTLGPPIVGNFGFDRALMDSAIISMTAAGFLFVFDIISWPDARQVNWGVYLIIGAGLSLGKGLHESGVAVQFGEQLAILLDGWWYPFTAAILVLGTALISNAVNNTTVVAILAPIMADTATGIGLSPPELMLPMAFGATYGFIVPSASSRTALIHTTGEIPQKTMMKIGGIITVPLVLITVVYFWFLSTMGWM